MLTKQEQRAAMRKAMKDRLKMVWVTFKNGFWALLAPVIILGGIYSGFFTPTEAACVSVVYSIFVSVFIYKEMGKKELFETFLTAAVLNGVTSFLLGYSTVFSTFMTFEQVPQMISTFLTTVSDNPIIILLLINLILLVVGLFLKYGSGNYCYGTHAAAYRAGNGYRSYPLRCDYGSQPGGWSVLSSLRLQPVCRCGCCKDQDGKYVQMDRAVLHTLDHCYFDYYILRAAVHDFGWLRLVIRNVKATENHCFPWLFFAFIQDLIPKSPACENIHAVDACRAKQIQMRSACQCNGTVSGGFGADQHRNTGTDHLLCCLRKNGL